MNHDHTTPTSTSPTSALSDPERVPSHHEHVILATHAANLPADGEFLITGPSPTTDLRLTINGHTHTATTHDTVRACQTDLNNADTLAPALLTQAHALGWEFISRHDRRYPIWLHTTPCPPWGVWVTGNPHLDEVTCQSIAVTGHLTHLDYGSYLPELVHKIGEHRYPLITRSGDATPPIVRDYQRTYGAPWVQVVTTPPITSPTATGLEMGPTSRVSLHHPAAHLTSINPTPHTRLAVSLTAYSAVHLHSTATSHHTHLITTAATGTRTTVVITDPRGDRDIADVWLHPHTRQLRTLTAEATWDALGLVNRPTPF